MAAVPTDDGAATTLVVGDAAPPASASDLLASESLASEASGVGVGGSACTGGGGGGGATVSGIAALIVAYRISSGGYTKVKPPYITKEACLLNFLAAVLALVEARPDLPVRFILIKDACTPLLARLASRAVRNVIAKHATVTVEEYDTALGSGAASFNFALDAVLALALPAARDATAVYMVEDDYLHVRGALVPLLDALALAPYVTGYDHPDKYVAAAGGGNPLVAGGGEFCVVMRGADRHWRVTNSTTMTFATTLAALAADEPVLRMFTATAAAPDDFHMWLALAATRGRTLVCALPALATHGETAFLAPYVDWDRVGKQAAAWAAALAASDADVTHKAPRKSEKADKADKADKRRT